MENIKYKIIDNFLTKDRFEYLQKIVMGSNFPYYFNNILNDSQKDNTFESKDSPYYFTHSLFNKYTIESSYFENFKWLIDNLTLRSLIRMKINFYPRTPKIIEHAFHVDYPFPHKGCILYFNTCDGYTLLKDGTKIETIENRALFFDSSIEHSSTTCTNAKARINVNINYL